MYQNRNFLCLFYECNQSYCIQISFYSASTWKNLRFGGTAINSPNWSEVVPISPQTILTPKSGVCDSLSIRIPEISSDCAFRKTKSITLIKHNFFILLKFLRWHYPDQVHGFTLSCMVLDQTAPQGQKIKENAQCESNIGLLWDLDIYINFS